MLQQQLALQKEQHDKLVKQASVERGGDKGKSRATEINKELSGSQSEVTIYKNAVQDGTKRVSSSSEEDLSDNPLMMIEEGENQTQAVQEMVGPDLSDNINELILGERRKVENSRAQEEQPCPSTSRGDDRELTPEERAQEVICQAELAKVKIFPTPGEGDSTDHVQHNVLVPQEGGQYNFDVCNNFVRSAMVDEHYQLVGEHVDLSLRDKIEKGDYVDFGRLLPKDRVQSEEEDAYRLVFKGVSSFELLLKTGLLSTVSVNGNRPSESFQTSI